MGNLVNLKDLSLHQNHLSGAIPAALGNLADLEVLQLHENGLVGTVPTELGNLTGLKLLTLFANQITGALPESMTALAMLEEFFFRGDGGLCAPRSASFQAWLQAIRYFNGPTCLR